MMRHLIEVENMAKTLEHIQKALDAHKALSKKGGEGGR